MILWHYTTGFDFDLIRESGALLPGAKNSFLPAGERPANWFSANQEYEETIGKVFLDCEGRIVGFSTKEYLNKEMGGLVRIGVAATTAPHDWNAFKRLSGVKPRMARALYQTSIQKGAKPSEWFVTFDPVPRSKWLVVERWDGSTWCAVDVAAELGQAA